MKNQTVRTLFVVVLFCFALTGMASAQNQILVRANVPFDFVAQGKTFSAGQYVISRLHSELLGIRHAKSMEVTLLSESPVGGGSVQSQSKIVFHRYGDRYFLAQVWTSGDSYGSGLHKSEEEKRLEKSQTESRLVAVTIPASN